MKIIIDLQGLQANIGDEIISRQTLMMARSMIVHSRGHDIYIALNHTFPSTIDRIRHNFTDILGSEKILVWQGLKNVAAANDDNDSRAQVSHLIYENYIKSLRPDVVHTTGLWQGWTDDATTSILRFDDAFISAVTLYPRPFRDVPKDHSWYLKKISQLKTADLIFAIDEIDNDEILQYLEIPEEKIITVSTSDKNLVWSRISEKTLDAFEHIYQKKNVIKKTVSKNKLKKLAYVSPFPPEQSGIADYSAGLLPELAKYFEIELITDLKKIEAIGELDLEKSFSKKTIAQFYDCAGTYDHILYHLGNSPFHAHMIPLLTKFPGTVVLHDFFISALLRFMEWRAESEVLNTKIFQRSLYESHGYHALKFYTEKGGEEAALQYPANYQAIVNASGIIVHSQHSKELARDWYSENLAQDFFHARLPRYEPNSVDKIKSRKLLGIDPDAFVICCFGIINFTKQNDKVLLAWLKSSLATNKNCSLYFVGPCHPSTYSDGIKKTINSFQDKDRIILTNFVDSDTYNHYLSAADVGIQLRKHSRGETSVSVLDCLSHKLATIVNACGSFSEISDQAVYKLADDFSQEQLVEAIEALYNDNSLRVRLQKNGYDYYKNFHTPKVVAPQYVQAIEYYMQKKLIVNNDNIFHEIEHNDDLSFSDQDVVAIAAALSQNSPYISKQFLIDITNIVSLDLKTGIERVTRSILLKLLTADIPGYKVEPIYRKDGQYYYAREFTMKFLGIINFGIADEPIDIECQDIFLGLDLDAGNVYDLEAQEFLQHHSRRGLKIYFVVYDVLPISNPQWFPEFNTLVFKEWLTKISISADGLIGISLSTANQVANWVDNNPPPRLSPLNIGYAHLGADIEDSNPTTGYNAGEKEKLLKLKNQNIILIVGTVEPRKGHDQVIDAMEELWAKDEQKTLVIVGKRGWMVDQLVQRLNDHCEHNKRLFWFDNASDELLGELYKLSTVFLMASHGEGFGLPIIEAAQVGLPIIARDLPVFQEVAGPHAFYFSGTTGIELADTILQWFDLLAHDNHPRSHDMPYLTWQQSADNVLKCIFENKWSTIWKPNLELK